MTTLDSTGEYIIPREITFTDITLPTKRAVAIVFEDGTTRAVTFSFTFLEYGNERLVEIYWWDGNEKKVGRYSIIEELFPFEVKNPDTGITEFIVLPRSLDTEDIVLDNFKTIKMSPRLWFWEVDDL
jgi:hypothetical protein